MCKFLKFNQNNHFTSWKTITFLFECAICQKIIRKVRSTEIFNLSNLFHKNIFLFRFFTKPATSNRVKCIRCNNTTRIRKKVLIDSDSNFILENFISLPEVNNYIEHLLSQYTEYINQIGFKKIWYISTLIGKKEIHNCLTGVLNKLCDFIQRNGGKVIKGIQYFQERELNALVDLITLRDSEKMIVFEGSSFSEGYCMKVNSVVNPNKEYRIVNGLVPKVSDELYFNC
jgi:hypothetical protein